MQFAKVMFSQVFICLQRRGDLHPWGCASRRVYIHGVYIQEGLHPGLSASMGVYIQEGLHPGVCIHGGLHPGGLHPGGVYIQGDLHPEGSTSRGLHRWGSASWGSTSREVCIQGGLHPGESASRGVCIQGGSVSRMALHPRGRGRVCGYYGIRSTSGRY